MTDQDVALEEKNAALTGSSKWRVAGATVEQVIGSGMAFETIWRRDRKLWEGEEHATQLQRFSGRYNNKHAGSVWARLIFFKITWAVVYLKYKVAKNRAEEAWVHSRVLGVSCIFLFEMPSLDLFLFWRYSKESGYFFFGDTEYLGQLEKL